MNYLKTPELSICIVSYNALDYLKKCLKSIYASCEKVNFEVIVVDNNSQERNAKFVEKHYPQAKLIKNKENVFFAAANNQAFSIANGKYLLLLNPDTEIKSGSLTKMVRFLEKHNDIGVLGPKLLNTDGSLQNSISKYITFWDLSKEYLFLFLLERKIRQKISEKIHLKIHFVESMLGACLLVRRKVIDRVGPLDEYFKFYAEEVDFLYRVNQSKWKVCFNPNIAIYHHSNKSAGQNKLRRVASLEENLKSQFRFVKKHGNSVEISISRIFLIIVLACKIILRYFLSFVLKNDQELTSARLKSYQRAVSWLIAGSSNEKMSVYSHFHQ